MVSSMSAAPDFEHVALVYDDSDRMLEVVSRFVDEGRDAGDHVLIEAGPRTREQLHARLREDHLRYGLIAELYRHPHQTLWGLQQLLAEDLADGRHVRLVSEVDYGGSWSSRSEWGRAEALTNDVLAGCSLSMLCLFDTSRVDSDILAQARATHPDVSYNGGDGGNAAYEDPREYLRLRDKGWATDPLEATQADATVDLLEMSDLALVRSGLDRLLRRTALPDNRQDDFRTAVFEVASNALLHGGDEVRVVLWSSGDRVLCRVRDNGPGLPDPMIGYLPPTPDDPSARRGLWSARQLADLMTTTMEPPGFTVRLSVDA